MQNSNVVSIHGSVSKSQCNMLRAEVETAAYCRMQPKPTFQNVIAVLDEAKKTHSHIHWMAAMTTLRNMHVMGDI